MSSEMLRVVAGGVTLAVRRSWVQEDGGRWIIRRGCGGAVGIGVQCCHRRRANLAVTSFLARFSLPRSGVELIWAQSSRSKAFLLRNDPGEGRSCDSHKSARERFLGVLMPLANLGSYGTGAEARTLPFR